MRIAALLSALLASSFGGRSSLAGIPEPAAPLPSAAGQRLTTTPDPVVLGAATHAEIEVRGLPRGGKLRAAVNVGEVESLEDRGEVVAIRYRLPEARFPQVLCLVLWRQASTTPMIGRLPLLGRALVPFTTRPNSQVTLVVGGRRYGPSASGRQGKLSMSVLVAPGVSAGEATVVDSVGLTSRKPVEVRRPAYPELAMLVRPERSASARPFFEIAVAAAEATGAPPIVEVQPPGAARPARLRLAPGGAGAWRASWAPDARPAPGRFQARAWLAGAEPLAQVATGELLPLPERRPPPVLPAPVRPAPRRLLGRLALATGVIYNAGAMVSARFSLEGGADYPLGRGRIGLHVGVSLAWSSHQVSVPGASEPSRAALLLLPLRIGVGYRLEIRRFTPYVTAGFVAEVVRTSGEGEGSGHFVRTDLVPGFGASLGCELSLGRGGPFVQAGYEWARLAVPEVEGLVGGLIGELGYRLRI